MGSGLVHWKAEKRPAWLYPKEEEEKERDEGRVVNEDLITWDIVGHMTAIFRLLTLL